MIAISAVSDIYANISLNTKGTKNKSATMSINMAVHILSHRKKLIHFFLVNENIVYRGYDSKK